MKRGKVYIKDVFCGIITESEEGYTFEYDKAYLNMDGATALSPTMPPKVPGKDDRP
ncbi:MAG: HipA N-terminal domain-containing protein [Candidatus Cryptobacteroides sp.]